MFQYDEFGFVEEWEETSPPIAAAEDAPPAEPHIPMRTQFPEAGSHYLGGTCDGWEYRTAFTGSRLAFAYNMLRQFLQDEGYADVPLPETAADLKRFKKPRRVQIQMFAEHGYAHNPIKIIFPAQRNTLILCIYNEKEPNHLLRFHGL